MKILMRDLILNKRTNQFSITLPKKKMKELQKKVPPKQIIFSGKVDFKW